MRGFVNHLDCRLWKLKQLSWGVASILEVGKRGRIMVWHGLISKGYCTKR